MNLLSLDLELMGVFDSAFAESWICEAAGTYPNPPPANANPWKPTSGDQAKAKLAAQNGLKGNNEITTNREAIGDWIQDVTGENDTAWVGQNFRVHDWHFIKSLGIYDQSNRPAIIDTLELALLWEPEATNLALEKIYLDEDWTEKTADDSPAPNAGERTTKNCPEMDAEQAYEKAVGKNNENGLLQRIKAHPLKELLDQILLRNAEHSDWLSKDWQGVINLPKGSGEAPEPTSCDYVLEKLKSELIGNADSADFKCKFCEYLETDPYACAYFVCWLARVQGTAKKDCEWEKGTGKFAPHPWIVQNHPAVLHLIRLYFANELQKAPATANKEMPPHFQEAPPQATKKKPPLEAWLHAFSANDKWTLKGRYVEIPAACKGSTLFGPKFPKHSLDRAPVNSEDSAFGIHQADVIGRILGHDTQAESKRMEPTNFTFSPANIFIAPTGFGKSLCYQLPAFIMARAWKTLTLVISPLQAIQLDQVRGMKERNPEKIHVLNTKSDGSGSGTKKNKDTFTVAFLNSTLDREKRKAIAMSVIHGECDMLFLGPEQLLNRGIVKMLSCRDIGLVAIDEAHCLSMWGHAFRPAYMYIAKWLDSYCQERMRRMGIPLKTTCASAPTELSAFSWSSYADICALGATAPFPRVALFTATLEPRATADLQELFLPTSDAANHIVGGYAPRPEYKLLVEGEASGGRSGDEKVNRTNDHLRTADRCRYAAGLLTSSPFGKDKKQLWQLPVLIYSTTVKQTVLIYGNKYCDRHGYVVDPPKKPLADLVLETLKEQKAEHSFQRDNIEFYHGKRKAHKRHDILTKFIGGRDKPNIILCTSAFGMGVDRPDICAVIMLGMPPSLNDLLQQAGRAARDPEKMAETLGLSPGTTLPALAILCADTTSDVELHEYLNGLHRICAETLEKVWKQVREAFHKMQTEVQAACGPGSSCRLYNFDPIGNCSTKKKITLSASRFEDIEDEELAQSLYWLERLQMLERLPSYYKAEDGNRKTAHYCLRVEKSCEDLPPTAQVQFEKVREVAKKQWHFLAKHFVGYRGMDGKHATTEDAVEQLRAQLICDYYDPTKRILDETVLDEPEESRTEGQHSHRAPRKQVEQRKHQEVFYQIADEVPWELFDGLSEWHNQPQLRPALELLGQLKQWTADGSTDNKDILEPAGLICRDGKWFVAKLSFDCAETPFVQAEPAFAVVVRETGITSLSPLLAEPRVERKECLRALDYDDRKELLLSLRKERKGRFRAPHKAEAGAKLPSTATPDVADRVQAEIAGLGPLGFLHRACRETPVVMEEARGWRLREFTAQPGVLAECRNLLATWPEDGPGLGRHLKPYLLELLDRLAGSAGTWPERLGVFMVPATDKPGWLFCRDRWDLFCQRCSAIERDSEEWKVFKKTLKQLWKEPREITLKAAFVKL